MTADTNEALAGELRGYAALLQRHPDIESQSIRLPGTSEVIDLREVLDALSERVRHAADMLTAQAAKLAELKAEVGRLTDDLADDRFTLVNLGKQVVEAEADADRLAEALARAHGYMNGSSDRLGPAIRQTEDAIAAHQKRRAG